MRFVLTSDVREFQHLTASLFEGRIECNIHTTVLQGILEGRHASAVFAHGLDERDQVRFAALRTPPWFMLATKLEPDAAGGFIDQWLAADPEVPGINALPGTARAVAAAWVGRTGGTTYVRMREALHVLEEVREPARPASGRLRPGELGERDRLAEWMRAFAEEAGVQGDDQMVGIVEAQLSAGRVFVWDDNGPVAMLGTAPRVSGLQRIGPVYTPPEHRCRGYASTLVAAVSRQALQDGAKRCMLFTDLANPTSNHVYAAIGYQPVCDWLMAVVEG
jgi:predicted GNAT family acetyltransferase